MNDPLNQWIVVPDDQLQDLPPVDDDFGLKDFASLVPNVNHPSSGLLLDSDHYQYDVPEGADAYDSTVSYDLGSGQHAFFPNVTPSPCSLLFPPPLSPDSSPTSAGSSPCLRTPGDITELPPDALDAELCSATHFLDQSGHSLEDIHFPVNLMEDIACTPHVTSSFLVTNPFESLGSSTPAPFPESAVFEESTIIVSAPTFSQAEDVLLEHPFSLSPSSALNPSPFDLYSRGITSPGDSSLTLSPLSTLSFFSSPGTSPIHSPLASYIPSSMAPPCNNDVARMAEHISSPTGSNTSGRKRGRKTSDDARPLKIPRRTKAKNLDDDEWNPAYERVKRTRTVPNVSVSKHVPGEGINGSDQLELGNSKCDMCGLVFTRTSDYVRHMENSANHPATRKMWPCPLCDKVLGRKDALMRHVRTLHGDAEKDTHRFHQ